MEVEDDGSRIRFDGWSWIKVHQWQMDDSRLDHDWMMVPIADEKEIESNDKSKK